MPHGRPNAVARSAGRIARDLSCRKDCAADAGKNVDAIIVAINPAKFALAAAEDSTHEAQLIERLCGHDAGLLDLARILVAESADDYREGSLFWSEVASNFIDGLIARHTSECATRARGTLGKDVLKRLKDYVFAHIDEPIEVSTLASIAGRSQFHFSRVFTRICRHDSASLRRASAIAAGDRACSRATIELRRNRRADRFRRPESLVTLGAARSRSLPLAARRLNTGR
jgi:AraC-like DNA-binding protein